MKQVVNLELSKKLFDLQIRRESLFVWGNIRDHQLKAGLKPQVFSKHWLIEHCNINPKAIQEAIEFGETLPAYTVAELGEILPEIGKWKMPWKHKGKWYSDIDISEGEYTEANARAKMLIFLIENSLLRL